MNDRQTIGIGLAAACLLACSFPRPPEPDARSVDPATCTDSPFTFARLCGLSLTGDRELSGLIDTGVDAQCSNVILQVEDSTPELCVISAATITIPDGATVRATGSRPLVLVAATTITISGTLDVSSTRATTVPVKGESLGAGADSRAGLCAADFVGRVVGSGQGGGGGGAGGSLGGRGGAGADGNVDGNDGSPKAFGGDNTSFRERTTFLRGGCRGQAGGTGRSSGGAGGFGGPPGGAVFLAAASVQIVPSGRITANGGGGGGGAAQGGGGGGGSGGFVAIEAEMITNRGVITAKGGGGGQGGYYDDNNGGTAYPGAAGRDPEIGSASAANGGQSTNQGGNGGPGAAISFSAPMLPEPSNNGGGGGGGGAGRVLAVSSTAPAVPGVAAPLFLRRDP
jgi:hypothetical protein